MNVDARLQLTISQRLVMTPMLQQAIKLLQMSRLELVDLVKQELMENPVLDEVEDIAQYQHQQKASSEDSSPNEFDAQEQDLTPSLEVIGLEKRAKQEESSINWEDYFADNPSSLGYYGERDNGDPNQTYEAVLSHNQSLSDHLLWQLHMSRLPERMFNIGAFLIGQVDDAGYICCEAVDAPKATDPATLILAEKDSYAHRTHVLEVLQKKLNVEFERNYLLSILEQSDEKKQGLFSLLLSQDYYESLAQHRHEDLLEKLRALTFEQIETTGKLICEIPGEDLERITGIPAAEITAALETIQKICRDLRELIEQHFAALVKEQYEAKLEKFGLSVEELYLVEYLLLHVSAEEIAYVASKELAEKAVKREDDVRDFLEKLRQSYAHVDQLQSHKYFLIQLYRMGVGILLEHLKERCPSRYHKLFIKLSEISLEMVAEAEAKMQTLLKPFRQNSVPVSLEEVEHALRHIQTFTPAGVGARDLQECLLIQARNLGVLEPVLESIIQEHLKDIQQRRYAKISDTLNVSVKEIEVVARIVANMSPRPGGDFWSQQTEYIVPDIYVYRVGDNYEVVLNDDDLPYLRINPLYKKLVMENSQDVPSDARQYVEQKLRSAMWFIRSVEQRKRTIYKVGKSLVKFQRDFLEHGVTQLKPLVLRDVADDISMHESTVSRVTTNKYIHTPQGVFELKFFFHSGLESSSGADVSSIAVKERIKQLITDENPARPLSDKALEKILKQDGIEIARRTIAKYREELNIPSSLQRKGS